MFEVGIGVLFAAWFVIVYLLAAKLCRWTGAGRAQRRFLTDWSILENSEPGDAKESRRALTTEELSEHHSASSGKSLLEKNS